MWLLPIALDWKMESWFWFATEGTESTEKKQEKEKMGSLEDHVVALL
jgi:hypothetical protein